MTIHDPGATGNGPRLIQALVWPVMVFLALILVLSIGLTGLAFFAPNSEIAKTIGQTHGITRLAALLTAIPSFVILALTDKIEGPVAAAALSGIAGYILGQTP